MKRALLIITVFLITAGFAMYILGTDAFFKRETIGLQYDLKSDTSESIEDKQNKYSSYSALTFAGMPADAIQVPRSAERTKDDEWKLVWADDFDKRNLNLEYWTEVDRRHCYNNELQYYLPKNSYIKDDCLYLTAIKEKTGGKDYTSAMVDTGYKLSFRYGRIEARIKLPKGKGLFPAFWILTYDGGYEIDIMEMIGSEDVIYGTNHYESRGSRKTSGHITNDTPGEFHTYAVEWERDSIRWYMDDKLYHTSQKGVPQDDMYIVLNLAVGGNWPGKPDETTTFPCSMAVDYVRIYDKRSA